MDNLRGLLPGLLDLLFGLGLCLLFETLGLLGVFLGLGCGFPQCLQLILHLPAVLFQAAHHLFKGVALLADQLPGPVHNGRVHAQPLGDGKGVGFAGNADQQPVGGAQSGHVKLAAAVFHTGSLDGIGLQLRVVGGAGQAHPLAPQLLDDRFRQGGALYRVGARSQLVQQDQAAAVRHLENLNDVHHVGRKGGKGLLNALLVSDVRQNVLKHGDAASLPRRNHQAAHGHEGQQADGLQGHGLAAGVGAGDDERVEGVPQGDFRGNHLFLGDQRMAGAVKNHPSIFANVWHHRLHFIGHLGLGEDQIQLDRVLVAFDDGICERSRLSGKLQQNAGDLLLLVGAQNPDFVVGFHHAHRLHKHRGPAGRGVVDQAWHLSPEFGFHRNHVAAAPLGDNALLQMALVSRGADQFVQLVPHPLGGRPDLSPDGSQLRRGVVRHFFLADNAGENLLLQIFVGRQHLKPAGEGRADTLALAPPLGQSPNSPQGGPNVQQLPQAQTAPCLSPAQGVGHIFYAVKRGRAVFGHGYKSSVCLLQQPLDFAGCMHRRQLPGKLRPIGAGTLPRHHF